MKKQIIITFLAEVIVLLSGLLAYKLAATSFIKEIFSVYVISRRSISFLLPLIWIGLTIEIPKHLACGGKSGNTFFVSGAFILVVSVAFASLALNLFDSHASYLLYGSHNYSYIIFPTTIALCGLTFHSIAYSYFRGSLDMLNANLIQLINNGLIPILAFYLSRSISELIVITGSLYSIVSFFFLIKIFGRINNKVRPKILCMKILFFYGIQRLPGDVGLSALFMLPAIISTHIGGINAGGSFAFSIALLNMISSIFSPLGLVLLPKISLIIQKRDYFTMKNYCTRIFKYSVLIGIIILVIFEIFADFIIEKYIGSKGSDIIFMSKLIMLGCPFYTLYISFKSVIDAYHRRSVNTRNILISLALFVSMASATFFYRSEYYLIICFVLSLAVLCFLTLFDIYMILKSNRIDNSKKIM